MAEQIISPGVFTRENDLSFLPQGVGAIGAAIIGPTEKGPAFVPTVVRSISEFERRFGPLSSETYIPQTVREYLKNAGTVTVCRVLAGGGYTFTQGTNEIIVLAASGSGSTTPVIAGVIYPSKNTSALPSLKNSVLELNSSSAAPAELQNNFKIILSGSGGASSKTLSASLNPSNANYIFKQLGSSPNSSTDGASSATAYDGTPGYTYINFKNLQTSIQNTAAEVVNITLGGSAAGTIFTSSLHNTSSAASGALYLTNAEGEQHTLYFSSSAALTATNLNHPAMALGIAPVTGVSGALAPMDIGSFLTGDATSSITFANLAQAVAIGVNSITSSVSNLPLYTASVSSNTVTITHLHAGAAVDASTTFTGSHLGVTQSIQGTDVTGYPGLQGGGSIVIVSQSANLAFKGGPGLTTTTEGYGYASTPAITSQFLDANKTTKDLFTVHTLDHGKHLCHEYKISILNLKEPADIDGVEQYSKFSLQIRKTTDTDTDSPLEQFNNLDLNPASPNYIARVIGDRYPQYNETLDKVELLGNYPNISNYVRVEPSTAVEQGAISPKLSPKGFAALYNPIPTSSLNINVAFPSASYEGVQTLEATGTTYNVNAFLGFKGLDKESDNEAFLQPIPTTLENNVAGAFNVENYSGHPSSSLWSGSLSASIDTTGATGPTNSQLKFTVPFQGGDDGIAPHTVKQIGANISATNLYGFDLSTTSKAGYKGYKKALDILSNQDEYDINMLAMPGVIHSLHPLITNAGIDMAEGRGDTFFVMDLSTVDSAVNTAISNASGLDTNYAASYYPWVKVLDPSRNIPTLVPPSVVIPGAIAASDRIGFEWFVPAGLNRGVLGNVIEAKIRLNQAERDRLYDAKINPIATFPQTGVCIWGQKTLQERSTALDRINVRRLLITVKKFIASSSRYLVFEQNTLQTRRRFLNIVNPYLESVQQSQGLFAFRVVMDESNNTAAEIDRNELRGAIYLQPTRTAEFVVLDFNVLPTGATFDGGTGGAGGTGGTGGTGGGGGY